MFQIIVCVIGIWLVMRWARRQFANEQPFRDAVREVKEREDRVRAMEMGRKLDMQVAQDAINQATRAKAALIAVLSKQGCTDEQIADVLKSVDNEK